MTLTDSPRIGIIGGGIQGCTIAMELARHGIASEILEQSLTLMDRASRWNEGKLHLGFVYARDESMATARAMVEGSCAFFPFFHQFLGDSIHSVGHSSSFDYVVHRDSLVPPAEMFDYLRHCEALLINHASSADYWPAAKRPRITPIDHATHYNPELVAAAFRTPEISINPHRLAELVRTYALSHPLIHVSTNTEVRTISRSPGGTFTVEGKEHTPARHYDLVVNASWESRLALDHQLGLTPPYRWLHRYKMACQIRGANVIDAPSATIALGAFGDLVNFGDGSYYLSWYPDGKIDESSDLKPREAELSLTPAAKATLQSQFLHELTQLIPSLAQLDLRHAQSIVRGGHIFAWGDKDVDHYNTQLHERASTGVTTHFDTYHTVNTGKYCSAPLNARETCHRILESLQLAH
ncbi:FAD-dependent oxidoreductase [Sulfuriroseicoccus oceanibius]|uniref:FAD-dependent oxidoreductase n=1 Tax=Sulfuriroseicoccus oceanibius TaxID=2707525 RepID=A0A6B3LE77_9BACT|nr:FAD-dependent oxidoreductase [Sulfuriroseicoccus oceanibius]QQL45717.1 FAD-dependent oxidoreductase [Sulfuriroseicoccus oceanibius]